MTTIRHVWYAYYVVIVCACLRIFDILRKKIFLASILSFYVLPLYVGFSKAVLLQ